MNSVGVSMQSDMEFIPIPIRENIDLNQCHEYGTLIHSSDISSLSMSLFIKRELLKIVEILEKQMQDTRDSLVKNE